MYPITLSARRRSLGSVQVRWSVRSSVHPRLSAPRAVHIASLPLRAEGRLTEGDLRRLKRRLHAAMLKAGKPVPKAPEEIELAPVLFERMRALAANQQEVNDALG